MAYGSRFLSDIEKQVVGKGKDVLAGRYRSTQDPLFTSMSQTLKDKLAGGLGEVTQQAGKTGLPGISAAYLKEQFQTAGADSILNTANLMQQRSGELTAAGLKSGGAGADRQLQWDMLQEQMDQQKDAQKSANTMKMIDMGIDAAALAAAPFTGGASMVATQIPVSGGGTQTTTQQKPGGCSFCYIMKAGEGEIVEDVRKVRDFLVVWLGEDIGAGYVKMSKWLVPLMEKRRAIKFIVRAVMTKPIGIYCQWRVHRKGLGFTLIPLGVFWLAVWKYMGSKSRLDTILAFRLMAGV